MIGIFILSFVIRFSVTANGWGDPHYGTFDMTTLYDKMKTGPRSYTFNEDGRFVLLRIIDDIDANTILFELQAETKPSLWPATVQKRLGFGVPGVASFQVANHKMQNNDIITLYIYFTQFGNGFRVQQSEETGFPLDIMQINVNSPYLDRSKKAVLWADSNELIAVFKVRQNEISLKARWIENANGDHINFNVWVPEEYMGKTRGLLGNYDGNHCNDFMNRANEVLMLDCNHPNGQAQSISSHMNSCKLYF